MFCEDKTWPNITILCIKEIILEWHEKDKYLPIMFGLAFVDRTMQYESYIKLDSSFNLHGA
jgi:hypothetical protein